jgi:hypothetical protein
MKTGQFGQSKVAIVPGPESIPTGCHIRTTFRAPLELLCRKPALSALVVLFPQFEREPFQLATVVTARRSARSKKQDDVDLVRRL